MYREAKHVHYRRVILGSKLRSEYELMHTHDCLQILNQKKTSKTKALFILP